VEFYWGLVFGVKNVLLLDNKTGCSSILLVNMWMLIGFSKENMVELSNRNGDEKGYKKRDFMEI
jgi:hypothetical protein